MPTCLKCRSSFPGSIVIEGKRRNLQQRKYCLDCSPFGSHNTNKLHLDSTVKSKKCYLCDKQHTESTKCCSGCKTKVRRFRVKNYAVKIKGERCTHCGWSGPIAGFHFHHLGDKEFNIGKVANKSWVTVKKELEKCILLCATCHCIEHSNVSDKFIDYALNEYQGNMFKTHIDM